MGREQEGRSLSAKHASRRVTFRLSHAREVHKYRSRIELPLVYPVEAHFDAGRASGYRMSARRMKTCRGQISHSQSSRFESWRYVCYRTVVIRTNKSRSPYPIVCLSVYAHAGDTVACDLHLRVSGSVCDTGNALFAPRRPNKTYLA
jgi:hypothetical protein